MQNIFKNPYKRHDIFSCNHSAHHRFGNQVSTYYILEEKQCFPDGCMNFIWRCRLLNKGHACPRKFTHVGRKCFSCKEFYDEKFMQQPRLLVSPEIYREFLREKDDFDFWTGQMDNRSIEIDTTILGIKPDLTKIHHAHRQSYRLNGWILVFDKVYINYDLFDDAAYAWISPAAQEKWLFSIGDSLEAKARFRFQHGRLVLNHLHGINIKIKRDAYPPNSRRILVSAETASVFPVQPEKCMQCSEGVLLEKTDDTKENRGPRRHLVCLQGIKDPVNCIFHLSSLLKPTD